MSKILIVADPEDSCFATPRGLGLAAALKQEADIVGFVSAPLKNLKVSAAQQAKVKKRLLKEREKTLEARVRKHRKRGQKVSISVQWAKDPVQWINKKCAGGSYLGVVKTGRANGALVGSSGDWELLRECRAPVLLVAEKKWHRTKPVLAALDMASKSSRKRALNLKVLSAARDLAAALQVPLEIITAIEVPTLLTDLDLVDPATYAKEAKREMQPQIKKMAATTEIAASTFKTKRGPVEKVITSQAAKVRAQIVVMGTIGRTGVKARLLGNTAEKVLEHLHTDVLAIKP
ncbi:MAG: universal stress protein [Halioglobus sp.]